MNFLAPGAFFLGLLLPVIVAMYLLKLRRVEREVSSTYLWRKVVRDVEANAPWQKLRPNLLMILQLLFLAAMILALTRPFQWAEGAGGQAAIFILDASASMAATDVAPSRIESAKQRARQLVDELPAAARVTVIEAGREARVLVSSSLDRRQAHLSIQNVQAGSSGSDMTVSLELASAIASRQPGTEIIVFSDGRVSLPERLQVKGALRYLPFGLSGENQAISLLSLEPAPGGASLTAFVQVANYGQQTAARRLSLYSGSPETGALISVYDLDGIPGGGQRSIIAEGLPVETRMVQAVLSGQDALPLDDRAAAVRPDTRPVPVTLVSRGNLFLKTALSLLPGVVLSEQDAAAPTGEPGEEPAVPTPQAGSLPQMDGGKVARPAARPVVQTAELPPALTIFDNTIPDVLPESGSLLFIAPPRSTEYFTTTGMVTAPAPRIIDPADPLAGGLAFEEVAIQDAVQIPLPDWATPVLAGDISDGNTPLLFRGEVNGRRIAVLAFDLQHSDLPLQVAFPLLTANLIDWLAPGARSVVPPLAAPGEALSFPSVEGARAAAVTRPDGTTVQIEADAGRFFLRDTDQLGVYTIRFDAPTGATAGLEGNEAAFAVNLFSPQESYTDPADNLTGVQAADGATGEAGMRSMREWWRPLALLALGLLTGEWLVYQRAALARLRDAALGRLPARAGARRTVVGSRKGKQ
jgi:hypothetical protein